MENKKYNIFSNSKALEQVENDCLGTQLGRGYDKKQMFFFYNYTPNQRRGNLKTQKSRQAMKMMCVSRGHNLERVLKRS